MAGRSRPNDNVPEPASVYEDFRPHCERKEEQGANILLIHLPGFAKEQIKVTYVDSSRTIKVQGEGAVDKNRRSRFNQAFPVPQNCIIEKIQGSFRNGVLTITMPKQTVKDVNTSKEATPPKATSDQKPIKDQKETTPPRAAATSGFDKQRDEKIQPPPRKPITQPKAPTATGPQTVPPKTHTDGKGVGALQQSKQQEETQQKAASMAAASTQQTQEKTAAEIVEKKAESRAGLKNLVKEEESGKSKDNSNIPKILEKGKKYDKGVVGAVEEKPKAKECGSGFLAKAKEMKGMDAIMKTVKRLGTDDYEDQQLLLNIGVSVLVIVALGAYITYSYRSSGKAKN